ncbi:4'-phosphopantetheinyl transferase superfamily protein [Streptomyces sp. NPDC002055]|uniref:4'-phosphopantetheinyl transferase family protein n=1 Tax=Streptomyces sp. NPDC002055 TaxID=3154534 RepID=UPI00332F655B
MGRLLPSRAVTAESFGDDVPAGEARLFPEEEVAVARSVDKRRREFTTVRVCARRALAGLGHAPVPLVPGERGAPSWPAGVAGSMTHCDGYRACAVARDTEVVSLGIDAEPAGPLPDGVLDSVTLPGERELLRALAARDAGIHWERLIFSAKESVYKTWFPLTRRWLGFEDAFVELRRDGTFGVELLVPGLEVAGAPVRMLEGRWLSERGVVLTAVACEAPA